MTVLPAPSLPPVISSPSPTLLAGPHEPGSGATAEMLRTVRVTNLITWAALSVHSLLVEPVRDHLPLSQVQWWGVLNVIFLAPVWLQIVHLLVAELFWVLVVLASANLLYATVDCNSAARTARGSMSTPSRTLRSDLL